MAIPKFPEEYIQKALQYIDENGVPEQNRSKKYELVVQEGKKYPPKYVIAVAAKLATGKEVKNDDFNAIEAKGFFEVRGYRIDMKKENKELTKEFEKREKFTSEEYKNPYSKMLLESKNIIFRGAPGTGKSFLAKKIAADIISNGCTDQYADLTPEEKQQVEFVQFHPSYDYSDFVEGLRPKMNDDGSMGFELQDGIFKRFVKRARRNCEDSLKSKEMVEQETSISEAMDEFLAEAVGNEKPFRTTNGSEFYITGLKEKRIQISIPQNISVNAISINIDEIKKMLESEMTFEKNSDITKFLGIEYTQQRFSYDLAIYREILKLKVKNTKTAVKIQELKKYIFIIDEINRGEISKILGELFFSIDPGCRGKAGEVVTQYSNMHENPEDKFYIPENVYIIGTMNDIDRSVDSFDFAMRRRFRFVEIKAEDTQCMLDSLKNEELKKEAIKRMDRLNAEILKVDDLNENYQIGASYFLKLKSIGFNVLWTDYLSPLLQEYIRGLYDEEEIMKRFAKAYEYVIPGESVGDEAVED